MRTHFLLFLAFLLMSSYNLNSQGVRYVSPTGVDVSQCDDPDFPCQTIAYTILQAETHDTIRISEGVFTEPDGIIIEKSLVLLGKGDSVTIIQAHEEREMATNRVITVDGIINATISGVTIRHGYANQAGSGSLGGGIYCDSANLVLNKVRFYNNSAEFSGGAITCLSSSVKLMEVQIDSNFAYAQSQGGGGGIYMRYSKGSFSHISCKENSASWIGLGGGAYLLNCFLEIDSSSFVQNFAQNAGGIFVGPGSILLSNSEVLDNRASSGYGGGIYTIADTLILRDALISENYAGANAGGIYFGGGNADLTNVSIRSNRSSIDGGGIYIINNNISRFENVVVDSNRAGNNGGGMYHAMQVGYTLTGIRFHANEAKEYGGGLCNGGDSLIIHNIDFEYNKASKGGGLYLFRDALVEYSTFYKNHASESGGGMSFSSTRVNLSNSSFIENTATQSGGGLSSLSGTFGYHLFPIIKSTIFKGNSAGGGGGMINGAYSYPYLESVIFDNNSAQSGGGFLNTIGKPTLTNTMFSNNSADYGGGLNSYRDSVIAINTLFIGNVASSAGGAIWNGGDEHLPNRDSYVNLANGTVSQNSAPLGGGIYNELNGRLNALNTIFWGNIGDEGKEIYNDSTSSSSLQYSLCSNNLTDVVPGKGIDFIQSLHTDPLFLNADEDNYQLTPGSPAIHSGDPNTNTGIFPGGPGDPFDYDLNPRIIGPAIDMGALEWQGFVSLEKDDQDATLNIYPNPASNSVFLRGNENLERVTIYNLTGQVVFEDWKIGTSEKEINISSLMDGMYILNVSLDKAHYTFKILKE